MCCSNFTIENWLTIISLIFVLIGGGFALLQFYSNVKIKRAKFINKILEKIRFDKDIVETMYIITYNEKEWYNDDFHNNKQLEESVDKFFAYLDYICYLKLTRILFKQDFKIFKYIINRVCLCYSTQTYLWNLYNFSKKHNSECSFQNLVNYGINNKFFPKDFKTNITLYDKTLNW